MAKTISFSFRGKKQGQANTPDAPSLIPARTATAAPVANKQYYSPHLPTKIYVEKTDDGYSEYSEQKPATLKRFYELINGFFNTHDFTELFYCLPEVFAPIHEIASRIADCNWELLKDWNDEVDYNDAQFNKLFSQPNPLQGHKDLVYWSVVYEILSGANFEYFNKPDTLVAADGEEYKNILGWFNLPAQQVKADMKDTDPYSATEISDFVARWKIPNQRGGWRNFDTTKVIPTLHLTLDKPFDLNCRRSLLSGAEKAIDNLIPVYEARKAIYVKRGALGFLISQKGDESGLQSLTKGEREQVLKEYNDTYGVTGGKEPVGVSTIPLDFIRTAMSIEELQPFVETLADAVAIYKVLRVPRHLVPSIDNSTFANADADLKSFYVDVIIPWARRKAQLWTSYLAIPRRYIKANFSHVDILRSNEKIEAEIEKIKTDTAILKYEKGITTKNERAAALGYESKPDGNVYATDIKNADPLATRLGVGGIQALQAVLADTTLDDEAKKNVLIIVFGISEEDAGKMVISKPPPAPDPNKPDPITEK